MPTHKAYQSEKVKGYNLFKFTFMCYFYCYRPSVDSCPAYTDFTYKIPKWATLDAILWLRIPIKFFYIRDLPRFHLFMGPQDASFTIQNLKIVKIESCIITRPPKPNYLTILANFVLG